MTNKYYFFLIIISLSFQWAFANNTTFDFESGNIDDWTTLNVGGGISITQEAVHDGSYAVKMIASSTSTNAWDVQLETPQITTVAGHIYKINFWAKAVGNSGIIRLSASGASQLVSASTGGDLQYLPDLDISSDWAEYTYENVYGSQLSAGGSVLQLCFDAGKVANTTYYIDDIYIEDVTTDNNGDDSGDATPLAAGHSKFLGNIVGYSIPGNFGTYWNQVTPENAGKWGSLEYQQDVMNWTSLDLAYNYAKNNNFGFKFHTFVWGSQEPSWITSLSADNQKAEMEELMQAVADRYPDIDYIDVVNEPLHAPSNIREALGGDGTTGWDWIVWSFTKARALFPNAKLLINEYGIITSTSKANQYVKIVNILKERGLIDGIGIQCHQYYMNRVSVSTMKSVLSILGATGLPVYVSELDINGVTDDITEENQYLTYKEKFPVLWESEYVAGITLWGYISGTTWIDGTGIVEADGTERKAMQWLQTYMTSDESHVVNYFDDNSSVNLLHDDNLVITPNPASNYLNVTGNANVNSYGIYDISGRLIQANYNLNSNSVKININNLYNGTYILKLDIEKGSVCKKFVKK